MSLTHKHILLITSTNLACNPRCLKEVKLLRTMGVEITVVAFNLHNWTTEKEKEIKSELSGVNFHYLETTKHHFFSWFYSSLLEKITRKIAPYCKGNFFFQAISTGKRSWLLFNWIKKWKGVPSFIIAHNPPAFYAAARLAKLYNLPFAIDIEDYHPGEGHDKSHKNSIALVMKEIIPQTAYTSYASPLIKIYTEKYILKGTYTNGIIVNNVFSQTEFSLREHTGTSNNKLKFIWFSQFVDKGRGLEKILPVLDAFSDSIELTLIGELRQSFFMNWLKDRVYISCIPSLPQKDLNKQLGQYDIGLALEDIDVDINRNICLTNKIWAYFQAGLYIIASDTDAQKEFLRQHTNHGIAVSLTIDQLSESINDILINKENILSKKNNRFEKAKRYNWEVESKKLENKWIEILQ